MSDSTSCRSQAGTFQSESAAGVVCCSCHLDYRVDSVGKILGQRVVIQFELILDRGGCCKESTKGFGGDSDVQEREQRSICGVMGAAVWSGSPTSGILPRITQGCWAPRKVVERLPA